MRTGKKGRYLLILALAVASLAGCKGQESNMGDQGMTKTYEQAKSPEDVKEQTLDYLNGQYEDTFTVKSTTAISWAEKYETITVTSEKYSGKTFLVRRFHEDKGIEFKDNYFTLTMVEDAEQYARELAGKIPLHASVSVEFTEGERPEKLGADAVFRDYVKMGGSPFCYITLTTAGEVGREEQLAFMELLADEGFQCNVVFESGSSTWRYAVDGDDDIREYN